MARVVVYRGLIRDGGNPQDPDLSGRYRLQIPSMGIDRSAWAPIRTSPIGSKPFHPQYEETVLVTCEAGRLDRRIVFPNETADLVPGLTLLRGIVTDADDPTGQGRVRVWVPSLTQDKDTNWSPTCQLFTQHSAAMITQGARVAFVFDNGDMNRPIILGALT